MTVDVTIAYGIFIISCSSGAQPRGETFYGQGNLSVILGGIVCDGSEPNLGFCDHLSWRETDCSHSEDVGILCTKAGRWKIAIIILKIGTTLN